MKISIVSKEEIRDKALWGVDGGRPHIVESKGWSRISRIKYVSNLIIFPILKYYICISTLHA